MAIKSRPQTLPLFLLFELTIVSQLASEGNIIVDEQHQVPINPRFISQFIFPCAYFTKKMRHAYVGL